ncbi:MAG: PEGA domain-containing protein [Polyangiaceae bacterium]
MAVFARIRSMRSPATAILLVGSLAAPLLAHAQAKTPTREPAKGTTKPGAAPPKAAPSSTATASESTEPKPPEANLEQKKADAKQRFEKAMGLFEQEIWDGALAEFLQSRASYATRGNTQNAAVCLKKLKRFDEAIDMYDSVVKEFASKLSADERTQIERELTELRGLVGLLDVRSSEAGASVTVDGRERGSTPLSAGIRLNVGSHAIRVYKEGFVPFEKRLDVAGGKTLRVDAKLEALGLSGRLSIREDSGKSADVVVDNVVVGKVQGDQPFQGRFEPGTHTVVLRGEGNLGTQPVSASVKLNQVTPLTLMVEPLESQLRVEPAPAGATVAIDGITVGDGVWEGRLRQGAHKIEVAKEGFLVVKRDVTLAADASERLAVTLERDPSSPLWAAAHPPKFVFEAFGAFALVPLFGGEVRDSCTGTCSSPLPIGVLASVHGAYQLGSGIGFGADLGYLYTTQILEGRSARLNVVGKSPLDSTARDRLTMSGVTLGASAFLHLGEKWPFVVRLGAGVLLATTVDRRTGQGYDPVTATNFPYGPSTLTQSQGALGIYVAPELRMGRRFGNHFELFAAARTMVVFSTSEPKWDGGATAIFTTQKQGQATFDTQTLMGRTMLLVAPGIGARYDF